MLRIGASASVDAYANGTIVGKVEAGLDGGLAGGFSFGSSVSWNGNSGWTESTNLSAGIAGVGFDLGETQMWGTNGSYAGGIANAGVWADTLASVLGAQASYNVDTGQASFGATDGVVEANFNFDSEKGVSFTGFSCPIWDELQTDSNWLQYATASRQSASGYSVDSGNAYPGEWQDSANDVGWLSVIARLGVAGLALLNEQPWFQNFEQGAYDKVQNLALAYQFYLDHGMSAEKIWSNLMGIDFSKPVSVVTLAPGTPLVNYQDPGSKMGQYFAPVGTSMNTLGISGNRQMINCVVTEPTPALESTAADTSAFSTWSPGLRGSGGGTQYYVPDNSSIRISGATE